MGMVNILGTKTRPAVFLTGDSLRHVDKIEKKLKVHIAKPISELRSVTCHMGSHCVTCRLTQVNVPRLNPSHTGRYLIYLPHRDGRLS